VFLPISPEERAWIRAPAVDKNAAPAPSTSKLERDKAPPREPPPLPGAPAVPGEPQTVSARFVELGKEAFKSHQYGRAERSFRQAVESFAKNRQAHFLLAQARFALAKYGEAVAAIYAGMRLQPTWPNARYRPLDLYDAKSDDFSDQLKRLANVRARNPDDPFLTFLYAYQLWFDGQRDEARLLFQQAKTLTSDPSFIERFLQANPGSSVDDVVVELLTPGPRF
jgi:tetratricopeptide (TPR) repeat protein